MRTLIIACVVALVAAVSAQTPDRPPDCNQLGFGDFNPTSGTYDHWFTSRHVSLYNVIIKILW